MPNAPRISFQGNHGAYSDMACRAVYPDGVTVPCSNFENALNAIHEGKADLAMVPIDNSSVGRVADIHRLLPESGLYIIGEHFQPIHHCLLGIKGSTLDDLKTVHSHLHALPQCNTFIKQHNLKPCVASDTAGAARLIAETKDPTQGAIASELAASLYGLDILKHNVEDYEHNTTRFLVMSPKLVMPPVEHNHLITTFVFRVRNIPAALYKALGGFASNGINITKLESYMIDGHFSSAQFYCDVDGHPDQPALRHALEELDFFAKEVLMLGTYSSHAYRHKNNAQAVIAS